VNLKQNLQLGNVLIEGFPCAIDHSAHGTLWNPSHGLGEYVVESIEDVPTIAEFVLDITALLYLRVKLFPIWLDVCV